MTYRTIIATLFLVATANAFAPISRPSVKTTALEFGFLKDLGIEKPSWLPDFGGEKKEDEPAAEAAETDEEGEEASDEAAAEPAE